MPRPNVSPWRCFGAGYSPSHFPFLIASAVFQSSRGDGCFAVPDTAPPQDQWASVSAGTQKDGRGHAVSANIIHRMSCFPLQPSLGQCLDHRVCPCVLCCGRPASASAPIEVQRRSIHPVGYQMSLVRVLFCHWTTGNLLLRRRQTTTPGCNIYFKKTQKKLLPWSISDIQTGTLGTRYARKTFLRLVTWALWPALSAT